MEQIWWLHQLFETLWQLWATVIRTCFFDFKWFRVLELKSNVGRAFSSILVSLHLTIISALFHGNFFRWNKKRNFITFRLGKSLRNKTPKEKREKSPLSCFHVFLKSIGFKFSKTFKVANAEIEHLLFHKSNPSSNILWA